MLKKLLSIRLSALAWILFFTFIVVVFTIEPTKLTPGQLALFSVNSFLFGYYFAPLLASQKIRVAQLISTARQEEMTILDVLTQSHQLNPKIRHKLKIKLRIYLDSVIGNEKVSADNPYYDELLFYTKSVKGEDAQIMNVIYDRISKTQSNRDTMNNLFQTKVYSHEWLVALVLFSITLYFALQTDYNDSIFFGVILAILCTGLTLLMVIMIKFSTLTHKEARRMWEPLKNLIPNHFEDITEDEVAGEKKRIQTQFSTVRQ